MRKINPIFRDGVARVGGRLALLDIDVDMQHRSNWVVGRVIRTLTDKEGLVRVAQVKARNTVLTRPVTKLCLIEKTAQ